MKYCTHCGNQIMDEAVICPKCGCAVKEQKIFSGRALNASTMPVVAACIQGLAMLLLFMPGMFLQERWIHHIASSSDNEYYSLLEVLTGGSSTYGAQKVVAFFIFFAMGVSLLMFCLSLFNDKVNFGKSVVAFPVVQMGLFLLQVLVNGGARNHTTTGISGYFTYSCWLLFYVEIFLLIALTVVTVKMGKEETPSE